MKKLFLILLLAAGFNADAQTLKELLYSGKLKKDSAAVIRKTDDLSTKIDTTQKKPAEAVVVAKPAGVDTSMKKNVVAEDPMTAAAEPVKENQENETKEVEATKASAPAKTNTKIWKEYTDALTAGLKDVLSNKKIKKNSYFFLIDYEVDVDGKVSVNSVTISPESTPLLEAVQNRVMSEPPQLNPIAKKAKRKQSFTIVKD